MAFPVSGVIGVDLTKIDSNPSFGLGTMTEGTEGANWIFACAEGSIRPGACVVVRPTGLATQVDFNVLSNRSGMIAFAQGSMLASQYGWFQNAGVNVKVAIISANPGAPLFTSGTSGVLDAATDTLSQYLILGVNCGPSTATGTTAMPSCSAAFPHYIRYEN